MTTTAHTDRQRGRPREFDEDAVVHAVTTVFAEKGFEAASLADIVEAAGLNKSSLYNAFGSKEELFVLVLRRYLDERCAMLEVATAGERGLDDLLGVIDLAEAESLSEDGRRGCLAVNATAELGFVSQDMADLSADYRAMIRRFAARPLERAAAAGEIEPGLVSVYADTVLSFMIAALLSARGGATEPELRDHFDALRSLVSSWRRT